MPRPIRRPWLLAVDVQHFRTYARVGNKVLIDLWTDPASAYVWQPGGRLGYLSAKETKLLRLSHDREKETAFATVLDVRDEYHAGGPAVRIEYPIYTPDRDWLAVARAVVYVACVTSLTAVACAVYGILTRWR